MPRINQYTGEILNIHTTKKERKDGGERFYFTVWDDQEGGYYATIFDEQMKYIGFTEPYATRLKCEQKAAFRIRQLGAVPYEVRPKY